MTKERISTGCEKLDEFIKEGDLPDPSYCTEFMGSMWAVWEYGDVSYAFCKGLTGIEFDCISKSNGKFRFDVFKLSDAKRFGVGLREFEDCKLLGAFPFRLQKP